MQDLEDISILQMKTQGQNTETNLISQTATLQREIEAQETKIKTR